MRSLLLRWIPGLAAAFVMLASVTAADQPGLDKLQGKWQCKTTNQNGDKITQVLEIKKDKLIFKVLNEEGSVTIYATGDVKLEKLGPFSVFTAKNVKGGASADSLEDIDDVFAHPYTLDYDTLYLGANFDKERDRAPHVDVYKKVSGEK